MKSKDQQLLEEAYRKTLKEQVHAESSIGNEIYNLYTDIGHKVVNIRTTSGKRVSDVLSHILNQLEQAVDTAKRYADKEPWEALQDLLKKIELDSGSQQEHNKAEQQRYEDEDAENYERFRDL